MGGQCNVLSRGGVRFPGEVGVLVDPLLGGPDAGGTVIKEAVLSRRGPFIALRSG